MTCGVGDFAHHLATMWQQKYDAEVQFAIADHRWQAEGAGDSVEVVAPATKWPEYLRNRNRKRSSFITLGMAMRNVARLAL